MLTVVELHIASDGSYEGGEDHCRLIDEALTSDSFPSLRLVQLYERIPLDYFPILRSRNLLEVYRW